MKCYLPREVTAQDESENKHGKEDHDPCGHRYLGVGAGVWTVEDLKHGAARAMGAGGVLGRTEELHGVTSNFVRRLQTGLLQVFDPVQVHSHTDFVPVYVTYLLEPNIT